MILVIKKRILGNVSSDKTSRYVVNSVCQKLVEAEWLDSFNVDGGNDIRAEWSSLGLCRRELLRHVIHVHGLSESPEGACTFTLDCQRQNGRNGANLRDPSRQFWMACLEELAIPCDREHLSAFIEILGPGRVAFDKGLVRGGSGDTLRGHEPVRF